MSLGARPLGFLLVFFSALFFLWYSTRPTISLPKSNRSSLSFEGVEPQSWSEWVYIGHSRERIQKQTSSLFKSLASSSPFNGFYVRPKAVAARYVIGRDTARDFERMLRTLGGNANVQLNSQALVSVAKNERHGILGGLDHRWSSGMATYGVYFSDDPLSMHKHPQVTRENLSSAEQHILSNAWTLKSSSEESDAHRLKQDIHSNPSSSRRVPLLELVRAVEDEKDREEYQKTAAKLWKTVYGAFEGLSGKSALQEAIEKLVRAEKVVVFSKTTCPYSKRAKALLSQHDIQVHTIEVDLRPDLNLLKPLLTTLTGHSTWPNIIIGGQSIGGSDDLFRLKESGELKRLLDLTGIKYSSL